MLQEHDFHGEHPDNFADPQMAIEEVLCRIRQTEQIKFWQEDGLQ